MASGNRVTMRVEGLSDLMRALAALPVEVKRSPIIYRALHDGARVIVKEAKHLTPELSGALRSGITQHASRDEDFAVVVRVRSRGYIFGPGVDSRRNPKGSQRAGNPNYWWLVEFGTSKKGPRSFLRKAFELKKVVAMRTIQVSLLRGLAVVMAKMGLRISA